MRESLYDIPEGCICLGDGLFGMPCPADKHATLKQQRSGDETMKTETTIQIWIDETDPERPYIVSRGVNGVDAPDTIGIYDNYSDALAYAEGAAERTGLRIIDEC